jgi:hypothetical protein
MHYLPARRPIGARKALRQKTNFASGLKQIIPGSSSFKNSTFFLSEIVIYCQHPVSLGGALRGRHGR